jgi:hypothetical protein
MKRPLQQLLPLVGALLAVLPSATARAQVTPDELEVVLAIDTSVCISQVIL